MSALVDGRNPIRLSGHPSAAYLRCVQGTPMDLELVSSFQSYVDQVLLAVEEQYQVRLVVGDVLERRLERFAGPKEEGQQKSPLQPPAFLPFVAHVRSWTPVPAPPAVV